MLAVAPVEKNPPTNAGDSSDVGLIPGSGRSPGVGNRNISSILAWKIPWAEVSGRLEPMGSQRAGHDREHVHRGKSNFSFLYDQR